MIKMREDHGGVGGGFVLVVVIWLLVKAWPRANPGARLAAIGAGLIGAFLLIDVASQHAGGRDG